MAPEALKAPTKSTSFPDVLFPDSPRKEALYQKIRYPLCFLRGRVVVPRGLTQTKPLCQDLGYHRRSQGRGRGAQKENEALKAAPPASKPTTAEEVPPSAPPEAPKAAMTEPKAPVAEEVAKPNQVASVLMPFVRELASLYKRYSEQVLFKRWPRHHLQLAGPRARLEFANGMQTRSPWQRLLCAICTLLALPKASEVSWVHPSFGSTAGGSFVVHFGNSPCTIIEASGERLVCETSAAAAGEPLLPCLRLSASEACEPVCDTCTFQYSEEKTPFISWISTRGLRAGDQVAFGAAQSGALLLTALDRAVVEIGGYICDASARQVQNSEEELVQSRTLNCALPMDLSGPLLANLQIRALPVGYDDPMCAHYPCIDYSSSSGYGIAVFRTWQGTAQRAPAFIQPNFQVYDLSIYPDITGIRPGFSGVLGGSLLYITGQTFDVDLSKTLVSVGDEACHVKSGNRTSITCELDLLQNNLSCVEFEVFVGASPDSDVKLVQHDGNGLEVAACRAEARGTDLGRSFTVNVNASHKQGHFWVEDSCQAEGRQIRGHIAEESEARLTFCCTMNGSTCVGPKYGQVTTTQPTFWTGWGPWVQLETTTADPLFGTCLQPQSHRDAELTCQLTGMRLCTRTELNSGLCCAADCIGDGSAEVGTWSSEAGYLQELAVTSDDAEPWTEELWIRCDEKCRFPFNVTYPDMNGTTTTTTKYSPEQLALWEFAPWLRPADFEWPSEVVEEILPLGPPVPEPLLPASAPMPAPFAGGRGLVYRIYYNPNNLPLHRALGHENLGYPQSPMETGVLYDMLRGALHHVKFEEVPATSLAAKRQYVAATPLSDDTGYDLYAEEIVGFFVAPFTGTYNFYLAADDDADLSLSSSEDMSGMRVVVRASSTESQAMPRFTPLAWFGKPCAQGLPDLPDDANAPCSVSPSLQFKAGERRLIRVRHRELSGSDWLRVGLRIHNAKAADGSPPPEELVRSKSFLEVQRLTMTASVVRERHRINLDRVLRGTFFVRVRRFARNFLREGTSGGVTYGDDPEKVAIALWETQEKVRKHRSCWLDYPAHTTEVMPKAKKRGAQRKGPAVVTAVAKFLLRNGVAGEILAEINVNAADELKCAVEKDFPHLIPFDLVYNGLKIESRRTMDIGLPEGATLDLLRLPKPKAFQQLARLNLRELGFNRFETDVDWVRCEDPSAFVISFQRTSNTSTEPDTSEVVMIDLARFSGENGDGQQAHCSKGQVPVPKLRALAADGTMYFHLDEAGANTKLCMSRDTQQLTEIFTFPRHFQPVDYAFVGSSLFILVTADDNDDSLDILELDRVGNERRLQRLALPGEATRQISARFLALDDTQQALWLITAKCLVTLQLPSLELHVCCLTSDLCKREPDAEDMGSYLPGRGIVLNPQSRELLLQFDASRCFDFFGGNERGREMEAPSGSCFLRRRKPHPAGKEWEVTYLQEPDLICSAMFTIDGFTNSFCFLRSHVVSTFDQGMRLLVLDAEGGLWQLEL
eukprot:s227_g30.t2